MCSPCDNVTGEGYLMGATNEVASERDGWRRIPCRGNAVVIRFEIIEPCRSGLRGDSSRRPTGLIVRSTNGGPRTWGRFDEVCNVRSLGRGIRTDCLRNPGVSRGVRGDAIGEL